MCLPEVSVGWSNHASKREAQALPPNLRRPSQYAHCEVVGPMHSDAAARIRERIDLCTMGLDRCYVGDLGLWWGVRLLRRIPIPAGRRQSGVG